MRLLELFSGTGSVGKIYEHHGYEVISLDIDNRANINIDILNWDYTVYPSGYFKVIWASPPCTRYSIMNNIKANNFKNVNQDLTESNKLVERTLEIIDYFKPEIWFIENPQTGKLKDQSFMLGLPYYDLDYCQYGWHLRKRTRLWTNLQGFKPRMCHRACDKIINGKHGLWGQFNITGMNRTDLRHMIPPQLVEELLYII